MGFYGRSRPSGYGGGGGFLNGRLIIAAIIAIISIVSYMSKSQMNPVTGEKQRIAISPEQEIALGLQAAPSMARQHGGESQDPQARAAIAQMGQEIVRNSDASKSPYQFDFHLLADPKTINAFALPGGQIFMTEGLYRKLTTPGQVAGVLAHEIGHVVGRHSAEQLAKQQLTQGLTGAAVLASYDPRRGGGMQNAAIAAMIGQMINMKYGRGDEIESDTLGVRYMAQAGYDPRSMVKVMEVLASASKGPRPPEFFSTHPNPENRVARIEERIKELFPSGVPAGLQE